MVGEKPLEPVHPKFYFYSLLLDWQNQYLLYPISILALL